MDDLMNFSDILTREPFYEVLPYGYKLHRQCIEGQHVSEPNDKVRKRIITQADFLREYYPSGHKINDEVAYPDIWKKDPETGQYYLQPITRTAFAFQQILATKQIAHLVGNDLQFELAGKSNDSEIEAANNESLFNLREGWLVRDMEITLYEAIRSYKITGDAAVAFYFNKKNEVHARCLSYLNEDKLYPHYDRLTGELELFARKYADVDETGKTTTEWVEIWDDTYYYRAKHGVSSHGIIERVKNFFGLSGFEVVEKKKHGFNEVPVAYVRNQYGACWIFSQATIEKYEEAYSYFHENSKSSAMPIFYTKGDGVSLVGDMNGSVKAIDIPEGGDAGYLQHQDISTSYNTLLDKYYNMIYEQSFGVKPIEVKSGDLPGVAIKLLYSLAIEKAISDVEDLQRFVNKLVTLFKFGYGYEINQPATLALLKISVWIEPYVHQNDAELFQNLSLGVQNKFMSKQTASERISKYNKNDEFDRILREYKQEMKLKAMTELAKLKAQADNQIRVKKAIDRQDINTRGSKQGRPNKSGREYDENGNWEGRNNWDDYNDLH